MFVNGAEKPDDDEDETRKNRHDRRAFDAKPEAEDEDRIKDSGGDRARQRHIHGLSGVADRPQ